MRHRRVTCVDDLVVHRKAEYVMKSPSQEIPQSFRTLEINVPFLADLACIFIDSNVRRAKYAGGLRSKRRTDIIK